MKIIWEIHAKDALKVALQFALHVARPA